MTKPSEFDWDAQRQRSQEQGTLLKEVRRRDGDACRVCGLEVSFGVKRESPLSLNYRILDPGTMLAVDGVVVVCRMHLADGEVMPAPDRTNWVENMATAAAQLMDMPAAPVVEPEASHSSGQIGEVDFAKIVQRLSNRLDEFRVDLELLSRVVEESRRRVPGDSDSSPAHFSGLITATPSQIVDALQREKRLEGFSECTKDEIVHVQPSLNRPLGEKRSHNSSPSVGAPSGALRDNSNPTEGDSPLTPAQRRATEAAAAVEREKEDAAEKASAYLDHENHVTPLRHLGGRTVDELERAETNGSPCPVGGDCKVSIMDAIDRGAVTVTRGLPAIVVWRRENPELAKTHSFFEFKTARLGMWPTPSHEALTDSITALAGVQRRLTIGGVLQCRGDNIDVRSAL